MKNWIIKNIDSIVVYLMIFIAIILLFRGDSLKTNDLDKQNETNQYKLPDGTAVSSSNTKEITKKELKELIKTQKKPEKALIKQFSEVKNITKTVTKTEIDSIKLVPKDSIPFKFSYSGTILKDNYSFNYESNQHGTVITNFTLIDSSTTVSGEKRKWLFGKETETKDIIHSNPNTKTIQINDIVVRQKKPWYFSDVAIIVYSAIAVKATWNLIKK